MKTSLFTINSSINHHLLCAEHEHEKTKIEKEREREKPHEQWTHKRANDIYLF